MDVSAWSRGLARSRRLPGNEARLGAPATKQWAPDPNVRAAPADYPIDVSESDIVAADVQRRRRLDVLYAGDWPR